MGVVNFVSLEEKGGVEDFTPSCTGAPRPTSGGAAASIS